MVRKPAVECREQLQLPLRDWQHGQHAALPTGDMPTPHRRVRDARGQPSGASTSGKVMRAGTLPARDARGRFVAFPTTSAPAWYVFCCDGYRVPAEPTVAPPTTAPPEPQALPRAIVRSRGPWLSRADLECVALTLIVLIASAIYWWHLPTQRW